MTPSATDIERDALRLTARQRARIALRLISSLEPADGPVAEIEAAWAAEAERRSAELDSGAARAIPSDEVFAALRRKRRR